MTTISKRVPWYEVLGKPDMNCLTAADAFREIGEYDVSVEELYVKQEVEHDNPMFHKLFTGSRDTVKFELDTDHRAILRHKMAGDDQRIRVLGIIGHKYNLVTPKEIVSLWDEHIGCNVTSMGALDRGERFFIATQLPSFNVAGDEVTNTLILLSPMNGRESIFAMVAPIRLICTNGMVSIGDVQDIFSLRHYRHNIGKLPAWLAGVYQRNVANTHRTAEVYNILAKTVASEEMIRTTLDETFPMPKPLAVPAAKEVRVQFEREIKTAKARRLHARLNFEGAGTGMNVDATKGTAYGLFNAIVELIDYGVPHEVRKASARSAGMGIASRVKRKALERIVAKTAAGV
jgi:hypothetical protein